MEDKEIKVLDKGFVRLVDHMGDDGAIVQAARVSYGKGTQTRRKDRELIRYLMRHRHMSPFEMCEFKFHCKMPIFTARHWIRHRTANVNEVSGRYSEMKDEAYVPDHIRIQSKLNKQSSEGRLPEGDEKFVIGTLDGMQEEAFEKYAQMLEKGTAREMARIGLPLSTYTEWYWKIDLRNLFNFLLLRMDGRAQWEIQQYANAIMELIRPIVPMSCEAFDNYIFNACTFSYQEMEIIRYLVNTLGDDEIHADLCIKSKMKELGFNKLERREFRNKLRC